MVTDTSKSHKLRGSFLPQFYVFIYLFIYFLMREFSSWVPLIGGALRGFVNGQF